MDYVKRELDAVREEQREQRKLMNELIIGTINEASLSKRQAGRR
jgi:hypothetical protein